MVFIRPWAAKKKGIQIYILFVTKLITVYVCVVGARSRNCRWWWGSYACVCVWSAYDYDNVFEEIYHTKGSHMYGY